MNIDSSSRSSTSPPASGSRCACSLFLSLLSSYIYEPSAQWSSNVSLPQMLRVTWPILYHIRTLAQSQEASCLRMKGRAPPSGDRPASGFSTP